MAESDLHILALSLQTIKALQQNSLLTPDARDTSIHDIASLLESPIASSAAVLDAAVAVLDSVAQGDAKQFRSLFALLSKTTSSATAAHATIARVIAALIVRSSHATEKKAAMKQVADSFHGSDDTLKIRALLVLGEIGKAGGDLSSKDYGLNGSIFEETLQIVNDKEANDDVRTAASFAAGNMAFGNLETCLPKLMEGLQHGSKDPRQHGLHMNAIAQVTARYTHPEARQNATLLSFAVSLWKILVSECEAFQTPSGAAAQNPQDLFDGARQVLSECLGKLALSDPAVFLPELRKGIASRSEMTRTTSIAAVKFIVSEHESMAVDSHLQTKIHAPLQPLLPEFFMLMNSDPSLLVRYMTLTTFHTTLHNKPSLVRDEIVQYIPLVYAQTKVKEELIRVVDMGPFKYKVDGGLDVRKVIDSG